MAEKGGKASIPVGDGSVTITT